MRKLLVWMLTPIFMLCTIGATQLRAQRIVIDGSPNEAFWKGVAPGKLVPEQLGVSPDSGGEVRAAVMGKYLYLSAVLPEPGGNVVARSIGVDPVWETGGEVRRDMAPRPALYGAPELEDFVRFVVRVYDKSDWAIQVGPLGAYSVGWRWTGERDWYQSDPAKRDRFLVASKIGADGWSVEVAVPLEQIGSPRVEYIRLGAERHRAERPETPDEWWMWPQDRPTGEVTILHITDERAQDPLYEPPPLGNSEPPIPADFVKELPSLHEKWMDAGWRDVPAWALLRNEPSARLPKYPAEVKLIQDGHTLSVLARCIEPGSPVARVTERDGEVDHDDSFQVFLSTSGSYYVQYAINVLGDIMDATGHQGSPRLSQPQRDWNSPVRGAAWKEPGVWFARLDIPLGFVSQALGEAQIPKNWHVLLVRHRPGRDGEPPETSVLPVTESATPFCPARYRRLAFVSTNPAQLPKPPVPQLRGGLAQLPSRVFSSEQRKQMNLANMFGKYLRARILPMLEKERDNFDQVNSASDWEHFRDPRLQALKSALGKFPEKSPLDTRVISEYAGDGYRRQNIVFQSQPGIWVTANLYFSAKPRDSMPGIIVIHSLHGPKSQFELQDMGIIWARAGCIVLVMDQVGYGERITTYPWDRSNINARYVEGEQLYLTGSSLITWMVWDTERGIDLLDARPDVNKNAIIVLGAVAGGGDPAAVTAAIDPRVAAVVPFNFGESTPEIPRFIPSKNQWPLDLADSGLIDWDTSRVLRRNVVDQFMQWFICASVAPRKFVYAYEFGWDVEKLPAWNRYRKVFGFYNALDNLAQAHGFGPFPGPGGAWNINPSQRAALAPTIEGWFGIHSAFAGDESSALENGMSQPGVYRQPSKDLMVLTPAVSFELHGKTLSEVARQQGREEIAAARERLSGMSAGNRVKWLREQWASKLGNIVPNAHPIATTEWTREIRNAKVEAIALEVEPGITVPLILLRPPAKARGPVVVAISEGGKDLFLARRESEIETLLENGTAVCLPDVRATGETTPDARGDLDRDEATQANTVLMIGETMLGERLRDVRTVLAYLRSRSDLDSTHIGLWGDSFYPANPAHLLMNEEPQWQISPEIEQHAEPLGGLLAVLAGLYENDVRAVAVRNGLVNFSSLLDDNFGYIPQDVVVPEILEAGDIADLEAALSPRPLLLAGQVDGLDRLLPQSELRGQLQPVYQAYQGSATQDFSIESSGSVPNLSAWFLQHLR